MATQRRRRTPKLCFTRHKNIGFHVNFRDPKTGVPTKYVFGMIDKAEAEPQYHEWVAARMRGTACQSVEKSQKLQVEGPNSLGNHPKQQVIPGSLILLVASWTRHEAGRTRKHGDPRR